MSSPCRKLYRRRAGLYIIVGGAAMSVAIVGIAALTAVRVQRRASQGALDMAEARAYAQTAIDAGLYSINHDLTWRVLRGNGPWFTNVPFGDGAYSLTVTDPTDGDILTGNNDSLRMNATGTKGQATYRMQVLLQSSTQPLDALKMAIHTAGMFLVKSSRTLKVTGAPASTNGTLSNSGAITGDAECTASVGLGTISGTLKLLAPNKTMPDSTVPATYAALGAVVTPVGNVLEKAALTPTNNPFGGQLNADGVYVVTTSNNLTIRNIRISGTLVVLASGKTVTIDQSVLIQNFRPDYPALIIDGNVIMSFTNATQLQEASLSVNFNPAAAPYLGASDADLTDQYPSEIDGLVHVRGTLQVTGAIRIRGAVICESASLVSAVDINANTEIVYDPAVYTTPIKYYTTGAGSLRPASGTWQRTVLP